jgi:hypothetical protein
MQRMSNSATQRLLAYLSSFKRETKNARSVRKQYRNIPTQSQNWWKKKEKKEEKRRRKKKKKLQPEARFLNLDQSPSAVVQC